jgi:hypothetical protein
LHTDRQFATFYRLGRAVPAIHAFTTRRSARRGSVDARTKSGRDDL